MRRGSRAHRGNCRTGTCSRDVLLNDQPAGKIALGTVDDSLLKTSANVPRIIVPAGPITNGIVYDDLCLELDEATAVSVNFCRPIGEPAGTTGKGWD